MNLIATIFGEGSDLSSWQMAARAAVMFLVTLAFIRVSGRRSFGQRSPFDAATTVLLGAVLSRGVVGASPFLATVAAGAVLVVFHRLLGSLSVRWDWIDRVVNGQERVIVVDGKGLKRDMVASLISERDLAEAVRKKLGVFELQRVRKATLERDGQISLLVSS
jgi:uncharacterized membrane protein YcaP (DUF421 family)